VPPGTLAIAARMLRSLREVISSPSSSSPSSAYSSSMRTTCAAQTWLAAICERMSPFHLLGVRTWRGSSPAPFIDLAVVVEL